MNRKIIDLVMIVVLISILVALVGIVRDLKTDGAECLADPLNFGYRQLERVNNAPLVCSCTLLKPGSPSLTFNGTTRVTNPGNAINSDLGELNLEFWNNSDF